MRRRRLLSATPIALAGLAIGHSRTAGAGQAAGATATEIKIGNTAPYSGPVSPASVLAKAEAAFFRMVNERGGVAGRRIVFISLDDGFSPPKTFEQTRRLVEDEGIAFMFSSIGTPTNSAVQRYLNDRKIPQLFVASGADKWGNYQQFPWTIGHSPSYRVEAQIFTKYLLASRPEARLGLLHKNDDFGRDYLHGVRDVLGDKFDRMVTVATYETTDPTVDSQIVSLQSAGADAFILATDVKFAAQAIRKAYDIAWKPNPFFLVYGASLVGAVTKAAGAEKATGIITSMFSKDPTDPAWQDDPGIREWRAFMARYLPEAELADPGYLAGYGLALTLMQVLRQCGSDFSRENIMRQATSLHDLELPSLLPGIRINTSPTNYHPIRQMQLARWTGTRWERFGDIIEGSGS
ncbi:MAG: ABC transporter substrate-binding protein [Alphaproteobacteria bacterium]|nr:ABC transporter substrate-binding protein [Alphaproteobacteria bacterium]